LNPLGVIAAVVLLVIAVLLKAYVYTAETNRKRTGARTRRALGNVLLAAGGLSVAVSLIPVLHPYLLHGLAHLAYFGSDVWTSAFVLLCFGVLCISVGIVLRVLDAGAKTSEDHQP
jgi:hypothetical protein